MRIVRQTWLVLSVLMAFVVRQIAVAVPANTKDGRQKEEERILDAVIVGGGFSGLTTAYKLRKKDILLLEKEATLGGRCQSGSWNGFHYPKGTEYIGKPEGGMKRFFRRVGIKAIPVPPPTDGTAYQGKLYLGADMLGYLNEEEKRSYYRLNRDLTRLNKSGVEDAIFWDQEDLAEYEAMDTVNLGQWMEREGYSPLVRKYVDVENRGLFGTDNANYSLFYNVPEMAFNMPFEKTAGISEVYSFEHGMYSVVEAVAQKIEGKYKTGASVTEVKVNSEGLAVVRYLENGKERKVKALTVVMCTPAQVTEKILKEGISPNARRTLAGMDYSKYVTINFFTKNRRLEKAWAVSCVDEGQVVTIYDVIRPQVEDGYQGKSIVSVYMAPEHAYDTAFLQQTDQQLLDNAYRTFNRYFPGFESEVLGHDITRFDYAFPVFNPGYSQKVRSLYNDPSLRGPVFLAGDFMVYATVDGAMISGNRAAKGVLRYLRGKK
ncbi:hypothetical protein FUAX_50590 (plasmid) [Fulvitalea axinellae]|uniref:Amine oxidase domain-containing protein n=1 Tax=Fulvitalea axinellae TaxID=1182444 RepID=A0AAU9CXV5_9BACT|nr:hypothetical protein FUAX_50590 [Fulvitalea axinellae]